MNSTRADIAPLPRTAVSSANPENLPLSVCVALAGLACLPIGLLWDISHHSTIGRDSFWTPAHIVIQLGGMVPALLFAGIALKTTFRGTQHARDASVSFWGLRAPLGVWVTIWGALAMMTSAPFDDWWHNRYGLDVKIVSPPHAVLGLGMFAVGMGVLLFVFSSQNRARSGRRTRGGLICALAAGARGAGIKDARSRNHRGGHLHFDLHRHDPRAAVVSRASKTRAHLSSGGPHGAARVSAAADRAGGGH